MGGRKAAALMPTVWGRILFCESCKVPDILETFCGVGGATVLLYSWLVLMGWSSIS